MVKRILVCCWRQSEGSVTPRGAQRQSEGSVTPEPLMSAPTPPSPWSPTSLSKDKVSVSASALVDTVAVGQVLVPVYPLMGVSIVTE